MCDLTVKRACREAQHIHAAHPVTNTETHSLERITHTLGAKVCFEQLPSNQAGFIVKQQHDPFAIIVVNSADIPERQRYTLAHEIGHLMACRSDRATFSFMDHYGHHKHYTAHECFADAFAGELLMPAIPLLTEISRGSQYSAAVKFGVTPTAINYRIALLQKYPPEELLAIKH